MIHFVEENKAIANIGDPMKGYGQAIVEATIEAILKRSEVIICGIKG